MERRTKISILSVVVLIVIILLLGANQLASQRVHQLSQRIYSHATPSMEALQDLRYGIARIVSSTNELLVLSASREAQQMGEDFEEHEKDELESAGFLIYGQAFQRFLQYHEAVPISGETLQDHYITELESAYRNLSKAARELAEISEQPFDAERIEPLREVFENLEQDSLKAINNLFNIERASNWQLIEEANESGDWMNIQANGIGFLSIIILLLYSLFVIRALSGESRARVATEQANVSLEQTKQALESSNLKLQEHRNNLEKLVKERTQALEVAKQNAESADRAKSTFLNNMSHELRTPLNAILGFSGMLARDRETTANHQEKLSIINRSGEHLLNMINSVLDLSKIEAGRVELEPVAFDLPLMLKDMGQMIEVRAESAGLRFDLIIDAAIAQCIKADSGKLRQILINLLGNAVTFTSEGMVSLRARTLPIADYPSMVTLQIEVEDNGPGIEAEHLEHIFEPFVQAGQALNDLKGSGLGLAISKSFVEMMSGEISVTSKPGKGSLFRVNLPVALAEAEDVSGIEIARSAVLGLAPNQTSWRIVIAEDNTDNRLLLSSLLIEAGFEIREAENGEQAVALFEQWHPHFIWMDMRMPVMDGYQATTKIRSLPGGDAVKIVAITASVFKEWKDEVMAVGADDFVRKPYRPEEIFDCMARQLGVRYLYEQEEEKAEAPQTVTRITPEMLAELPDDLIAELQSAVRAHDMEQTNAVLDRISSTDSDPELTNALRQLVKDMDFRTLKSLLRM